MPRTRAQQKKSARSTAQPGAVTAPGRELLPYQKLWANDGSRWKFGLMSRQVGKDFSAAFEGIRDCVNAELRERRIDWLIAAPSERQSLGIAAKMEGLGGGLRPGCGPTRNWSGKGSRAAQGGHDHISGTGAG